MNSFKKYLMIIIPAAFVYLCCIGCVAVTGIVLVVRYSKNETATANRMICQTTSDLSFNIIAGQHTPAGSLYIENLNDCSLSARFVADPNWHFETVHLWIGDDPTAYPQTTNGSPKNGNFPYIFSGDQFTTHTFDISYNCSWPGALCDYCGEYLSPIYILAHASLINTNSTTTVQETGWAEGSYLFNNTGNWAMMPELTAGVSCICDDSEFIQDHGRRTSCNTSPPILTNTSCETAFAKSDNSLCFSQVDSSVKRWGWTTQLTSTITHFDIYAAAGQCDASKGDLIGSAVITQEPWQNATSINVNIVADGIMMVHFYAGSNFLPTIGTKYTVAPGQYPVIVNTTDVRTINFDYVVDNVNDSNLYVILHADVCY